MEQSEPGAGTIGVSPKAKRLLGGVVKSNRMRVCNRGVCVFNWSFPLESLVIITATGPP